RRVGAVRSGRSAHHGGARRGRPAGQRRKRATLVGARRPRRQRSLRGDDATVNLVRAAGDVRIRPMRGTDVEPATDAILRGGWGQRGPALRFFTRHPHAHGYVAEADGHIVGTSIATQHGSVGWIGLVFVSPELRGRGLGAAMTRAALGRLHELGCRSVLLAATELGEPIYRRLGFTVTGSYSMFSLQRPRPTLDSTPTDPRVRQMQPADFAAIAALDRRATGEDRSDSLRGTGPSQRGWVFEDTEIRGFALRMPWGSGPTLSTDPEAGQRLLDWHGTFGDAAARLTVPTANVAACDYLRDAGFE